MRFAPLGASIHTEQRWIEQDAAKHLNWHPLGYSRARRLALLHLPVGQELARHSISGVELAHDRSLENCDQVRPFGKQKSVTTRQSGTGITRGS